MYVVDSLLSAASLAMDAFAVSICVGAGVSAAGRGTGLRMALACGFFQFLMSLIGWVVGAYAINLIASFDHWVAFGLLAFVGGNMIRGAFGGEDKAEETRHADPTRSITLLWVALATSIDALAVGAGFALSNRPVTILAIGTGAITAALCYAGVSFGKSVGCKFGKKVEFAGGAVLILIGLNILYEHIG